ncbi:PREDICTED: uncharacterized protein LOC108366073 [Rhagoletis zephyria]|uniref:uncharacterized protein LOC108366073 n=1 Tax=Rhagoletis zephyria TaxID=28612 RepID=UPI00081142F8|nr:PREDICTED: uncharacterized protein LOC108366073 [Rhagoletis zephyria]
MDSGATSHMCNKRSMFVQYEEFHEKIWLASNTAITALGRGDVLLKTKQRTLRLENVLYSPELKANFISISKAVEHGMSIKFESGHAHITDKYGELVLTAAKRHNLYVVELKEERLCALNSNQIWHNRYGHLNYQSLSQLQRNDMVRGMQLSGRSDEALGCNTCMVAAVSKASSMRIGEVILMTANLIQVSCSFTPYRGSQGSKQQ